MSSSNPKQRLLNAKGFIFDVDGTLALADKKLSGYQALPGAVKLIELLRKRGIPVAAFTNGSTKHPRVLNGELEHVIKRDDQTRGPRIINTPNSVQIVINDFLQHVLQSLFGIDPAGIAPKHFVRANWRIKVGLLSERFLKKRENFLCFQPCDQTTANAEI